jgi:acyl carrier protein
VLAVGVVEQDLLAVWDEVKMALPRYMLPTQYAVLANMPLTPNGKCDVKALQSMNLQQGQFDEYQAPETEIEIELAQLWQALLQQEKISITSNFFELGGHSLLAMQLIASINQAFSTELQVVSLFENSSIKLLAEIVENSQVEEETGWL